MSAAKMNHFRRVRRRGLEAGFGGASALGGLLTGAEAGGCSGEGIRWAGVTEATSLPAPDAALVDLGPGSC
jgi:hypothetical protein